MFAPMYREYGAQFYRGVKPREVLLYWGGDERGNDFQGRAHDFAWCVPIATQCLHAAGAALAFKIRKEPRVAVTRRRRRRLVEGRLLRRDQRRRRDAAAAGRGDRQQPVGDLGAAQDADRRDDAGAERHRRRPRVHAGRRQRSDRDARRDRPRDQARAPRPRRQRDRSRDVSPRPTTPPPTTRAAIAPTPK